MLLLRRGYVLMEVMMGGAMLAVLLATLLVQLADARQLNVRSGRDAEAARLVEEKLEELRGLGFGSATSGSDTPATQKGRYARAWTVSGSSSMSVGDSSSINFKDVTVQVDFDFRGQARGTKAATRVFQP